MADVPSQVNFGEVVGRFVQFLGDSEDPEQKPDELPLTGTVILSPLTTIIRFGSTDPPRLAFPRPVVCRVIDGDLYPPSGTTPGVWVIATDQPSGAPTKCQWQAIFSLNETQVQPSPVIFNVPAGGTVDLSVIAPVPAEQPSVNIVSHEDAVAARQAADEAAVSADRAEQAAASAGGTTPLMLGYRHVQLNANTVWIINHTLSFRPNVAVVDSAGSEIWPGDVTYLSDTRIQLIFSAAVGGEAFLS